MSRSNLVGAITGALIGLLVTFVLIKVGALSGFAFAMNTPLSWVGLTVGIVVSSVGNVAVTHLLETKK